MTCPEFSNKHSRIEVSGDFVYDRGKLLDGHDVSSSDSMRWLKKHSAFIF